MLSRPALASLPEEPASPEQLDEFSGAPVRVLFIEDDRSCASAFKRALASFAIDCIVAETAAGARALMRAYGEGFDAVLLDLRLPDGRGEDLLPELEALPKQPGIIIFSDFLQEMRPEATSYRAIPCSKQVTPLVLASLLRVAAKGYAECTLNRFAMHFGLTSREHEVLERVSRGNGPKHVALDLGCSLQAIYAHLGKIGRKTGCSSYQEIIAKLFRFSCHGLGHTLENK